MKDSQRAIVLVCTAFVGLQLAVSQQPVALKDTLELREQNSKLFVFYSGNRTLDDYVNLLTAKKNDNQSNEIVVLPRPSQEGLTGADPNEKSREAYLLDATANSDLIVIADPLVRNSAATEGNKFVFSDYEVALDRVFLAKNVTVLPGQHIVVTRPGGTIRYRGRTVIGSVPEFDSFRLNEPYIMFLRLLQNGTFLIVGESAYNMSDVQVNTDSEQKIRNTPVKRLVPKDQFVEDVERAVRRVGKAGN